MRLILAALIAFWTPFAQAGEPAFDALSHLLHAYAGPVDDKAAEAAPENDVPLESGERLARIQADLALMAGGFEAFRHPSHSQHALQDLPDHIVPELRPFFKDRDSTLDTIYRTLAVTDYTWALRFPEPACDARTRRSALITSKDGLFSDPKSGGLSAWLSRLLGPSAYGRTAAEALDQASSRRTLSARDYELLRVKIAKITSALNSEKAVGKERANLYCLRAEAHEALAAAHRTAQTGAIEASRGADRTNVSGREADAVLLIAVADGPNRFRTVGAGVMVETSQGPKVLSDASLGLGEDKLRGFARAQDGTLGKPLVLVVERADQTSRLMVGRLEGGEGIPVLKIAQVPAAHQDLVRAIGHTSASGAWTISQGLVTATGEGTFASDAILGPEMLGSPLVNDAGEVAGLVVLSPKDGAPSAVMPDHLRRMTEDGAPVSSPTDIQFVESRQTGSGSLLTAASPLSAPGGAGSNYIYSQTQYGTVRGRCMNCSNSPSSSISPSGKSAGTEIGEALVPLVEMLIFKGIPALFRKIGELFTSNPQAAVTTYSKTQAKIAPTGSHTAIAPEKKAAVPIKKKDPLKLTGLALETVPNQGPAGAVVKLVARLTLNDSEAPLKDIVVTFRAKPKTLVRFAGEPLAKTDSSGVATITATLRNDHGVRPVKTGDNKAVLQKSKDAFGDLDGEMRAMNADPSGVAEPEVEEGKDEPIEFDATATLGISLAGTAMVLILESEMQRSYEIDTSALIAITYKTSSDNLPQPLEPTAAQILPFLQANKGKVFISPQVLREYLEPVKRSTQEKMPLTKEDIAQRASILAMNQIVPTASASEQTVEKFSSARAAFRTPGDADILACAADHKRILITAENAHVQKYISAVHGGAPLPELKFLQFEMNLPPRLRP